MDRDANNDRNGGTVETEGSGQQNPFAAPSVALGALSVPACNAASATANGPSVVVAVLLNSSVAVAEIV